MAEDRTKERTAVDVEAVHQSENSSHNLRNTLETHRVSQEHLKMQNARSITNSDEVKDENVVEKKGSGETLVIPHSSAQEISPPVYVPKSERRGLFAQFTLIAEAEDPKTYSRKKKWFITFVVAMAALPAPMGSAIFLPSLHQVVEDLNTTSTITNLSIALYMLSMAVFPLWWSSFSEVFGRRSIYLVSFSFLMVFSVLAALSKSIGMLIVMQMLSGGASASVQAVGAGTVADLWAPRERGKAMGIFFLGPLCGPLLAPIFGGALASRWGWRSTLWFMVIFAGCLFVFVFLALPETLPRDQIRPIRTEAPLEDETPRQRRSRQFSSFLRVGFVDPLKVVRFLRFPPILLTVYYASITFGSLYMLSISIQATFTKPPYEFPTLIIGLLYIPDSLGYVVASFFGGRWVDYIMHREAKKAQRYDDQGKLIYRPEDRMRENAWLGAFMYPAALIWYGWTSDRGLFWLIPMIANFFVGIGAMLILSMTSTMLTEFMPKNTASAAALAIMMRNSLACIGTVVAAPIIQGIGNGPTFSIVGGLGLASCGVIVAMKVWGRRWRESLDAQPA